ncbi:hypothetical protein Acsp06_13870 [Actinomycetospora sp. NBRC 106375]|uniref:hypothetical protein n=1 Tax=Actinomycetospora sp. NBRC 106375 TaxID=3032207 RepID=UPI0024A17C41|nr:hypothetical protein [Actinomycetospora sp. NBRC 106375]GLZ45202.1 hypothetical protein Acsp06_13870 [Actinomycetospora sp. NBRC 106375]
MLVGVLGLPGVAAADPMVRCVLADDRLAEASGLVADPAGGYEVVNDSGNPSTVYRLDDRCAVVGERAVPHRGRDVEDLARTLDGTLWLADVGDNGRRRDTVAVLRLDGSGAETVERLTYTDGPHDAESLLVPADGRPVVVTKDLSGRSGVYVADGSTLRQAGEVVVPGEAMTALGAGTFTGGALSADGRVVALRTYTDAWLYPAPRGTGTAEDVVAALRTAPVRVPLPAEAQGEALAFAPDGMLLATGETPAGEAPAPLHAIPGATALVDGAPTAATPSAGPAPASDRAGLPEPLASIGVVLAAAVAVAALLAVVVLVRRRRR